MTSETRGELIRLGRMALQMCCLLALALLLLLAFRVAAQAQTESTARQLDAVLVSEYGDRCAKSYDPKNCLRWFVLMNEALDIEAKLNPPPSIDYTRPTTAQWGQRAEWRERLAQIPVEMKRLLPRVRGEANRQKLEALVKRLARERP